MGRVVITEKIMLKSATSFSIIFWHYVFDVISLFTIPTLKNKPHVFLDDFHKKKHFVLDTRTYFLQKSLDDDLLESKIVVYSFRYSFSSLPFE